MSALKPTTCQRCIQCSEEKLSLYKYSHSPCSPNCKILKTNFSGHAAPTLTLECLSIFCSNMTVFSFTKYLSNTLIDIFVSLNIKHKAFLLHEPCNQLPMLFHILIVWKETFFLGHQTCDVIGNTCIYPTSTCQIGYSEKNLGMCRKREECANEISEGDQISTEVKIPLLCDI